MDIIKNNLILIGSFIIIFLLGFLWYQSVSKQLIILKHNEKILKNTFDENNKIISRLPGLEREYDFLKEKWETASKVLIQADEPAFSYNLINTIILEKNINFDFDFTLVNKTTTRTFSAFTYSLQGIGSYSDVFKLLWYLTKTPILYIIQSVNFESINPNQDQIQFKINLQSYSITPEWNLYDEKKEFDNFDIPTSKVKFTYNSFKPLIRYPVKRVATTSKVRKKSNLIDVFQITLQAAMTDKIFIKRQNGKIVSLQKGDKVQSGYLSNIDLTKSEAVFLLKNNRKIILGLGYIKNNGKISSNEQATKVLIK